MTRHLKKLIDQIPGEDGWWTSAGREVYVDLALQLKAHYDDEDVADILSMAYWAAAEQFGA